MTQNASDVEIANQGFAAFRQDLNDVLEDITTLHSGTAAPSTTYANQWWYETDTDKLYIRNEDNDAWIEILTLDQANDHLATIGASITLDGTGNVSIDSGDFTVDTSTLHVDSTNNKVGIGTLVPSATFEVESTDALLARFSGGSTTAATKYIQVVNTSDDTAGLNLIHHGDDEASVFNQANSALKFGTNDTERMRIDSSGNLLVGLTSGLAKLHAKTSGSQFGMMAEQSNAGFATLGVAHTATSGTRYLCDFRVGGTGGGNQKGSITSTGTSVAYNTTSDYRLKENVTDLTGAIARVKTLQPKRFNFIDDADDTIVDGFLAHEAQTVVPEAVHGEKDAMRDEEYEVTPAVLDDDGNVVTEAVMGTRSAPDYQGIDQSKLVPLLTAALQEAITKIEALETKVAALEN